MLGNRQLKNTRIKRSLRRSAYMRMRFGSEDCSFPVTLTLLEKKSESNAGKYSFEVSRPLSF